MKVEVPIPGCYISANLYLHNESDTDLYRESGMLHFLKAFMNLNLQSALWVWFPSTPLPPAAPPHKEKTSHTQPETKRGAYV